tara:strand:+ start:3735 stop:4619 length:885 start_codon:yes stop_codon:yes gene_type:complete
MKKNQNKSEIPFHQLIIKFERAILDGLIAPQDIASHLNSSGITTLKGKRWNSKLVNEYLNITALGNSFSANECKEKLLTEVINKKTFSTLNNNRLQGISEATIGHYDRLAEDFWENTQNHDVSQNYQSFLGAIKSNPPHKILDFGCGPGRDLLFFQNSGHSVTGLDGSKKFVDMARSNCNCEILHQNFLNLDLPNNCYDGVFANASLFHVPSSELPRVLLELFKTIKPLGVLFCSNPRGNNDEGYSDDRYGCFFNPKTWREYVSNAGFSEVQSYYRPSGLPRRKQPWFVTVWRK